MSYAEKLQELQKEFKEIKSRLGSKRELKPHQQAVYDFVMQSKKSVEFEVAGYYVVLFKGHKGIGFKHILLKHYGAGCTGEITARDILNIGNVIKNDITLEGYKSRISFIQTKNDKKYTVIAKKKENNKLILNFFSSK